MHKNADKEKTVTDVQTSKLIAALDALVLNNNRNGVKKVESVNDGSESEVEIVAFGPVPIKPKKPLGKGVQEVWKDKKSIIVQGSGGNLERPTHPFFSKSSSSGRKDNRMERVNVSNAGKPAAPSVRNSNSGNTGKQVATNSTFLFYSYKEFVPKPTVVYTRHEEEANELIMSLKDGPVGFDMEWRVIFRSPADKGQDRRVAIVQIADSSGLILVIQVHAMSRFPKKLLELIENPKIPKLGVNIEGDGKKLFKDYGVLATNLVELSRLVHIADPAGFEILAGWRTKYKYMIALAKLVEYYFKKTLSKARNLRLGNWEAELEQPQIEYAANDAHCALKIYDRLLELAQQNSIELDGDLVQRRCSSSVSNPYPKALTKSTSCTEIPTKDSTSKSGPVQRHNTMPNVGLAKATASTIIQSPQHLRAYRYWYERNMSMARMRIELSLKTKGYGGRTTVRSEISVTAEYDEDSDSKPATLDNDTLKASTVISYVVAALQADPGLPFEMEKLRELVQMDGASWERHRDWILKVWSDGRGVVCVEHG